MEMNVSRSYMTIHLHRVSCLLPNGNQCRRRTGSFVLRDTRKENGYGCLWLHRAAVSTHLYTFERERCNRRDQNIQSNTE